MHRGGLTIPRLPPNINDTMTPPSSRPTNLSLHFPPTVHAKTHTDPAQSNRVYPPVPSLPGHVPINLQDGSKEEWARHVEHALNHPDRMRAANELKTEERHAVTNFMPQDEYDAAKEQLHKADSRLPVDVVEKAIQLFFSTNLLPDYDLSTCYVRELPNTSMLALIMPLPPISRFSMPPPFGKQHNHTWALCHGTTFNSAN